MKKLFLLLILSFAVSMAYSQKTPPDSIVYKSGNTVQLGQTPNKVGVTYIKNDNGDGAGFYAANLGEDTMMLVTKGDSTFWVSSNDINISPRDGDTSGKVGINTFLPTAAMDINGNLRVRSLYYGVMNSDNDGNVSSSTNVTAENFTGFTYSFQGLIGNAPDTAGVLASIYGGGITRCNFKCQDFYNLVTSVNNYIDSLIWTRNSTGNYILKDTTKYVGIGITEPTARLHIRSSIADTLDYEELVLIDDTTGNEYLAIRKLPDGSRVINIGSDIDAPGGGFNFLSARGYYPALFGSISFLNLTTQGLNGAPSSINIDDDAIVFQSQVGEGNVGIGLEEPSAKLNIAGNKELSLFFDTAAVLNDLVFDYSQYTGGENYFEIEISNIGTPDEATWSSNYSGGTFLLTGVPVELDSGLYVSFGATTGHTINDYWAIQINDTFSNPALLVEDVHGNPSLIVGNNKFVGISTSTPTTNLHVKGGFRIEGYQPSSENILMGDIDGNTEWRTPIFSVNNSNIYSNYNNRNFLLEGTFSPTSNAPASGAGLRFMWYSGRGAIRAGVVSGNQWDKDSIGWYSAAFGLDNQVKGYYSLSTGNQNIVSASSSVAFGSNNTILSGTNDDNFISGQSNNIFGLATTSATLGFGNTLGSNTATVNSAFAFGTGLINNNPNSIVLGYYNDTLFVPAIPAPTDLLFTIGNGTFVTRSNAISLLKNGNLGIDTDTPASKLTVNGDIEILVVGDGLIEKSPDGNCWRLTPDNTGNSVWTSITCP